MLQANRPRWGRIRERPILWGSVGVAGVAILLVVLLWFQPQRLLYDDVVDEAFPSTGEAPDAEPANDTAAESEDAPPADDSAAADDTAADAGNEAAPRPPAEPIALTAGTFTSRNRYTVEGQAAIYELADGSRVLRLEDFASTNGPDLYVYLTAADEADGDEALDQDFVDLGRLAGNIGNQNYDIPDDVDLARYDTVVIWCLRFTVGFGAADLHPPA